MKVLHAYARQRPGTGMVRQMEWEQASACQLGLNWDVRLFCPTGAIASSQITQHTEYGQLEGQESQKVKLSLWLKFRREFHNWLHEQEPRYDIILLRYYPLDPYQISFLRNARTPIYTVHHSLEGPEIASTGGIVSHLRANLESRAGRHAIRQVEGVIGVTPEIVEYEGARARLPEITSYVYPNGIQYEPSLSDERNGEIPELLFVASRFSAWHGLDLLLDAVSHSKDRFVLHVVGGEFQNQPNIPDDDPRVRYHGRLTQAEIARLAARCTLGLASFGLFRKNMKFSSSLKVRNYLMLGLPVYSGHQDVFPDTFPYFHCGACNINDILGFARQHCVESKTTVSALARPYIDKEALLEKLHRWLLERPHDLD